MNMNKQYLTLAGRIRDDLSDIKHIVERTESGWARAKQSGDDFYLGRAKGTGSLSHITE